MFICRDQFVDNIDGLIKHLKFEEQKEIFLKDIVHQCSPENELQNTLVQHFESVIKPSHLSSKLFTYCNSIVSLYGFLENFIEKIAEEFITNINNASIPVNSLPKSIKKYHLELSMQLLTKVRRDRTLSHSEKSDAEKKVIKNLNSFLQEDANYELNSKAFTIHTANFRFKLIESFFEQLGIKNIANRALKTDSVKNNLATRQQQDSLDDPKTLKSWLEIELDDLAQLRNEIAHGGFDRNIESFDLIIERAEFIRSFGTALADILNYTYKEVIFHSAGRHILGNAIRTFPAQNCFGFEGKSIDENSEPFTLRVGDLIFAHNNNSENKVLSGEISSLRLNKSDVLEINIPNDNEFSIKVNFEVTRGMTNRELSIPKAIIDP